MQKDPRGEFQALMQALFESKFDFTREWVEQYFLLIPFLQSSQPVVGVYGALKTGKSSLLNTILKSSGILKTDILEATGAITTIRTTRHESDSETYQIRFRRFLRFTIVEEHGGFNPVEAAAAVKVIELFHRKEDHLPALETLASTRGGVKTEFTSRSKTLIKAIETSLKTFEATENAHFQEPWEITLNLSKSEPIIGALETQEQIDRLHTYMSLGDLPLARLVRSLELYLSRKRSPYLASLVFVDMPGRASRHTHHNWISEFIERLAIDLSWYLRESTEKDASTTEFNDAARRTLSGDDSKPALFVVTKMDEALQRFCRDKARYLEDVRGGDEVLRIWTERTFQESLRRHQLNGGALLERSHFVSAYHDASQTLSVPLKAHGGTIENPVQGNVEALLLATFLQLSLRRNASRIRKLNMQSEVLENFRSDLRQTREVLSDKGGAKGHQIRLKRLKKFGEEASDLVQKGKATPKNIQDCVESERRSFSSMSEAAIKQYVNGEAQAFLERVTDLFEQRLLKLHAQYRALLEENINDPELLKLLGRLQTRLNPYDFRSAKTRILAECSSLFLRFINAFNPGRIFGANPVEANRKRAAKALEDAINAACNELATDFQHKVSYLTRRHERITSDVYKKQASLVRMIERAEQDSRFKKERLGSLDALEERINSLQASMRRHVQSLQAEDDTREQRISRFKGRVKKVGVEVQISFSADGKEGESRLEFEVHVHQSHQTHFALPVREILKGSGIPRGCPLYLAGVEVQCGLARLQGVQRLGPYSIQLEEGARKAIARCGVPLPAWGVLLFDLSTFSISVISPELYSRLLARDKIVLTLKEPGDSEPVNRKSRRK